MSNSLATPWTVALQVSLSMEFSRQGYWSGLSFSPPRGLSHPGITPESPALLAGGFFTSAPPGKPHCRSSKWIQSHVFYICLHSRSTFCVCTQSQPTLCNPMDCSPSGSSVHGILQARILEWVAICFSRGLSWARDWTWVSCITGRFSLLSH